MRVTPEDFRSSGGTDAQALNAMFAWAAGQAEATLDWRGTWSVDETVHITGGLRTQHYVGNLIATAPMDAIARIQGAVRHRFLGLLQIMGTGGLDHATRTCTDGLVLHHAQQCVMDGVRVIGVRRWGVRDSDLEGGINLIGTDLGDLRGWDCGSAAGQPNASEVRIPYTAITRVGGAASVAQRAKIACSPHPDLMVHDPVFIDGTLCQVTAISAESVTVFPWPRGVPEGPGDIVCCFGGALKLRGANGASVRAVVEGLRCGIVAWAAGLYGPQLQVQAEASGIALALAAHGGDGMRGAQVSGFYAEQPPSVLRHVVQFSRLECKAYIAGVASLDLSVCEALAPTTGADEPYWRWSALAGVRIEDGSPGVYQVGWPRNGAEAVTVVGNRPAEAGPRALARDAPTLRLRWDEPINATTGRDSFEVLLPGKDGDGPGAVTFEVHAADPAGTVMGGPTYTVQTTGPVLIRGWRRVAASDWRIWVTPMEAP